MPYASTMKTGLLTILRFLRLLLPMSNRRVNRSDVVIVHQTFLRILA